MLLSNSSIFNYLQPFYIRINILSASKYQAMDINDFKDSFKYKLLIPGVYLLSWILMFTGPTFFQAEYQNICIVIMLYFCSRLFHVTLSSIYTYFKFNQTVAKAQMLKQAPPSIQQHFQNQLIYTFIIPNYKEDIELLSETLQTLSSHSWARQKYVIFLAMEAHQEGSNQKAETMIGMFRAKFLHMGYTVHHMREYQQRGKASNVSWCVQHLQQAFFKPKKIDRSKTMLTIMDSDSLAPEVYIYLIEQHLKNAENFEKRHNFIYCPNQIFNRNHHESPIFTRICDDLHAAMHNAYMPSFIDIAFPLSNYTASYQLFRKIGFWDTCADAIGEDCHTTMKALWKTEGQVRSVPIYAPFNQVNISTGKGYCKDLQAKFWQTQRHGRAVADVSYEWNMFFKNPLKFRTFSSLLLVLQMYMVPATIPWATISLAYQSLIIFQFYKPSPQLVAFFPYIYTLLNVSSTMMAILYLFYYMIKRKAAQVLFNKKPESRFRYFQFLIVYPLITFLIDLPSFIISTFGSLFQQREYVVAQKVVNKKIQEQP